MKALWIIASVLSLSGCATLMSESENAVILTSAPSKANFKITNRQGQVVYTGMTPATLNLASGAGYFKRAKYTIEFQKPGYKSANVALNADYNRWYQMNFWTVLGVVGAVGVDPVTGAMWQLPERASQTLVPAVAAKTLTSAKVKKP
ncbi:hypothetical protein [Methylocucumis oryzae]|uniref:PEGA domain-containing protein n=1 Tax=Methylocucumis oryzae TaxID=1632867 RepID=A0A0F3II21_9GAMM|nr:hypothetical protein [Methylocucumis oryzae]KJV06188.1 hypothetical protein VZ94_12915 [Methylocucumis oryzae]